MLAVSCSKESELSKANAGKERPVVTIEQNNVTNYYLTFTVSTGFPASQFGYVVMPSTSTQAPVAQDIVMDQIGTALQSGVFNTVDKTKVKATYGVTIPHWRTSLAKCLSIINKNNNGQ